VKAELEKLPGYEIYQKGIADIQSGRESKEAYAVAIAALRLRAAGVPVPEQAFHVIEPHLALYRYLKKQGGDAHSEYNSLMRRLVRFEAGCEVYGG